MTVEKVRVSPASLPVSTGTFCSLVPWPGFELATSLVSPHGTLLSVTRFATARDEVQQKGRRRWRLKESLWNNFAAIRQSGNHFAKKFPKLSPDMLLHTATTLKSQEISAFPTWMKAFPTFFLGCHSFLFAKSLAFNRDAEYFWMFFSDYTGYTGVDSGWALKYLSKWFHVSVLHLGGSLLSVEYV